MKRSSGIVVDADVSRSSADPSDSPRALACARALMAIRGCESLHVAFEDKLKQEWHKHQGRFARKWLLSMHARRRVTMHTSIPTWSAQRGGVAGVPARPRSAAEKDLHLVELARHDGWKLVSLDDTARRIFAQACSGCTGLEQLAWANPTVVNTLLWLTNGANEAGPCLGEETPDPRRGRRRPSHSR
jgi:hypothetical protein